MKRCSLFLLLSLFVLCTKQDKKDILAIVGKTPISRDAYEAFSKVRKYYPTDFNQYFPANRSNISHMVETEALFSKAKQDAKGTIQSSKDWQWKKTYYSGQIFMSEYLAQNMGSTEEELKQFYENNKETFKKIIKATDSTKQDSVVFKEFTDCRDTITEILFLKKYPPDSSFLKDVDEQNKDYKIRSWFFQNQRNFPNFFMKAYYKEKYQKPFPDSINEVYGEGKIITDSDINVILSWVRPDFRSKYESEEGKKRLVEFLLQWKLFSDKAKEAAFTSKPAFKNIMEWAWKIEVANEYMKNKIEPIAKSAYYIDTSMIPYAIFDERAIVIQDLDSASINGKITSLIENQTYLKVDSMIFQIRSSVGVKFLQNDLKDSKDEDPVLISRQADSLRDTGLVEMAEKKYLTLTQEFPFTPEGKTARYELAKIQTERQLYTSAINNYRNFLLTCNDQQKKSVTFFMIGFIYDEYMNRSDLAEVNYKWVLKNDPQCELADDAEFMLLHLDEPMNSVEELQAQTLRQNRKVESFEDAAMPEAEKTSSEP